MDAKRFFPDVKFVLSTWYMDDSINGHIDLGEFAGNQHVGIEALGRAWCQPIAKAFSTNMG